jgi:hypothetical protein
LSKKYASAMKRSAPRAASIRLSVQVGKDHRVDRQWVDAEAAHRDQRRRAAVDEDLGLARLEVDARLEAPRKRTFTSAPSPALMISCRP